MRWSLVRRWRRGGVAAVLALALSASACSALGANSAVGGTPVRGADVIPLPSSPSATTTASPSAAATPATTPATSPTGAPPPASPTGAATPSAGPASTGSPEAATPAAASAQPLPGSLVGLTTADLQSGIGQEDLTGAGGHNVVRLINRVDGKFRLKGKIQLNHIPGPSAAPENLAFAYGQCNGCQTLAVALQINLISQGATSITPQNYAIAENYRCTGCDTVARALQYDFQVADPTQVPPRTQALIVQMNQELRAIGSNPNVTMPQAEQQVDAVVAQFNDLAASLNDQRQESTVQTSPNAPLLPATPAAQS